MVWMILPFRILAWHYRLGLRDLIAVETNLLWFLYHFFSLPILARTLFKPWRRLHENYARGLEPGEWFETLIVNLLMRALGLCLRLLMIAFGLVVLGLAGLLAVAVICLWLIGPWLLIILVVWVLSLILN